MRRGHEWLLAARNKMESCVRRLSLENVKKLIEQKASVNDVLECGLTPLMLLIQTGDSVDIAKVLVDSGADFLGVSGNSRKRMGSRMTPRQRALSFGRKKTAAYLESIEEAQAALFSLDSKSHDIRKALDMRANPNLDACSPILMAARRDDESVMRMLVEAKADLQSAGVQAAYRASAEGNVKVLQYLIEERKCTIDATGCLVHASEGGALPIVQYLHQKKKIDVHSNAVTTALVAASAKGHMDVLAYLCESKANLNAENSKGQSALKSAVESNKLGITKYLVKVAKARIDADDSSKSESSSLMIAAEKGYTDVLNTLLDADVNEKDIQKALMCASRNSRVQEMKSLVERKARIDLLDNDNMTPFVRAVKGSSLYVIQFLVEELGIEPSSEEAGEWEQYDCIPTVRKYLHDAQNRLDWAKLKAKITKELDAIGLGMLQERIFVAIGRRRSTFENENE
mmetsp:Transcript_15241/g.23077  ORF Transcript_15241/g.23077 Transcript_15241/m.23077 type:complete len:457 (+) Transcript_15241:61-1431(+)